MQHEPYPDVPPDFGHWLAGFIDGEGNFNIYEVPRKRRPRNWSVGFSLGLRIDDRPILEEICARTGLGFIYANARDGDVTMGRYPPKAIWAVASKADCARLVMLLERHPLRAKKARDFAIWAKAVRVWNERYYKGSNLADWSPIAQLGRDLRACRRVGLDEIPEERLALPPFVDDQLTFADDLGQ